MPRARKPSLAANEPVYGDVKARQDQMRALPTPQVAQQQGAAAPAAALPPITPLDAPTQRPQEPITAGLPTGPGGGPEMLGMGQPQTQDLGRLAAYLPVLEILASKPDTTQDMRNFVRLVRANAPQGR